ncbi:MAG: pitrilysin family protein [Candidatus Eisenbacteria bacterium]
MTLSRSLAAPAWGFLAAALLTSTASATDALPPMTGPSPGGVYEATLPNGLKVLMKEAHAAPIMCVSIWYRAGSKHEEVGQTGLAHLLEHMMYKGTARYGKGIYDRTLEGNGALNNASTWLDRTNYYVLIAADRVDIAMELEADRMRGALFTDEDLSDEMPVVRNEMEIGEDDPFTELDERIGSVAFLEHPYHWPTIGWKTDVEAIRASDIHAYYDRYYWPNNAYLVLVGDLSAEEMLAKAVQHFGALAPGGVAPRVVTVEPAQKGERRFLVREAGENRLLGFDTRSHRGDHPDQPALAILGRVLADGRSSRLYRALVETGIASDVQAYAQPMEDPFLFFVYVTLAEGADPDEAERVVEQEISRIATTEPSAPEVARAFKQYKVATLFDRDDITNVMFEIGEAESQGGYGLYDHALAAMEAVTPTDVQRVAAAYCVPEHRTVGFYLPNGEAGGSWIRDAAAPTGVVGTPRGRGPAYRLGRGLQAGAAGSAPSAGTAEGSPGGGVGASRQVLDNGAVLLVQESHENPTVAIQARLSGGLRLEPDGQAGVAALTAAAWPLGTRNRTASELAELLESRGISIEFEAQRDAILMQARCLSEDFPLLVEIVGEMLQEPSFAPEQIEIAREAVGHDLRGELENTYSLAYHRALRILYGGGSPYARLVEGDAATLPSLGRDEVVAYHRSLLHAGGWSLAVVGDVNQEETRRLLTTALASVPGGRAALDPAPVLPRELPAWGVVTVPVPDKSQVDLVFVGPGVAPGTEGYEAAYLANAALGEAYTSRLNGTLRDDEGLTYGAYSDFEGRDGGSLWVATLGVNPDNVGQALDSVQRVLRDFRSTGLTDAEIERTREYAAGSYALRTRSKDRIAAALLEAEAFGLGPESVSTFGDRLRAVSGDEIQARAKRLVDPEHLVVVVAGTVEG